MSDSQLIEFMQRPSSYPENPASINLVQTHISWVFIGDEYVYKVKKPVDFGFLNFSTLENRKFYVNEELRLNSRFSPDVYIKVVPISAVDGAFRLDDDSNIVEYALKMRRISEDHMLYRLLDAGKISEGDMRRIGTHLAKVYGTIPSDEKSRQFGTMEVISTNVIENFDQTRKYIGGPISKEAFTAIESWSLDFMKEKKELFEKRLSSSIKECHGDLHLQHICMEENKIFVFDCIEFNERFRFQDVASDIAFLWMDLDVNGYPDFGRAFADAYAIASKDASIGEVLTFYKVYRAYVRAKVTSFMLDDKGLSDSARQKASDTAAKYYNLAFRYVKEAGK